MRATRVFAIAAVLLAMTGFGAAAQTTLRIGLAEDPDVLDPTLARTYVGRIVFASLCDKLVDITPELDIAPMLATEWKWVDDNKGLVMKLRPGVKFHDGTPFTADDVVFSIEMVSLPVGGRTTRIAWGSTILRITPTRFIPSACAASVCP